MGIYIPEKIKVGYVNRAGTYTGKLAYVIYYDEKGKLRKETSWNSWRDNNIVPDDFNNEPTEGFVLNKKVGGVEEQWGWNARKTYCRIYDPRGFEFEIDITNLLWILEHCNSIKGKGLEGKFVYGWDGKDLVLIPVDSPDYKEYIKLSDIVNANQKIKAKDLKIGATYQDRKGVSYVYMGRFDYWTNYGYEALDGKKFFTYSQLNKYYKKKGWETRNYINYVDFEQNFKDGVTASDGKYYWFYIRNKNNNRKPFDDLFNNLVNIYFVKYKSISNKFISCIDENCSNDYADLFNKMEHQSDYSPVDIERIEYKYYTYEEFEEQCNINFRYYINFIFKCKESMQSIEGRLTMADDKRKIVFHHENSDKVSDIFEVNGEIWCKQTNPIDIKTVFDKLKPMYRQEYLMNGNKHMKRSNVINVKE